MALYSCYVQLPYRPFHLSHVTDTQQLVDCLGSMSVVENSALGKCHYVCSCPQSELCMVYRAGEYLPHVK